MKAFLIALPMATMACFAAIIACFELASWLDTNTEIGLEGSRWLVLGMLFVLILGLAWLWSYNNREAKQ